MTRAVVAPVSLVVSSLLVASLVGAPAAAARERRRVFEVMGFASDGEHFVVRKYDHQVGWSFSLRRLADGSQVRQHPFEGAREDEVLRAVERRYRLEPGTGPRSPDGRFVALGAQDGAGFDLLVLAAPRVGLVRRIASGAPERAAAERARVRLSDALWSPDGRFLVVVLTYTVGGRRGYERDRVLSCAFRAESVSWYR